MRIAIVGAGSWGTTMGLVTAPNGPVSLWARRPELAEAINAGTNPDYLDGISLPPLQASADLAEALDGAEAVLVAVPSHGLRTVMAEAADLIDHHIPVLSLTKGLEQGTNLRMTEVLAEALPGHDRRRIGVLSGPNLAREIAKGEPAATVIALRDHGVAADLQAAIMTPLFRVYTNNDVIGSELAGAAKNVMAIAAGMVHGLGFGLNTMAAMVTRALAEVTRLGVAMGGSPLTFGGLAGIGDLMATCLSDLSRNHRVGAELGKGRNIDDIVAEMSMVAEGVKTTGPVLELAARLGVEMPIAAEVGRVLDGGSPHESVVRLMGREAKAEGHGIIG
jgi:glycerol-3-phosphate dehydrogenase (NAD(P)+)